MAYTTINKSSEHFNTKLYEGTSGTVNVTGLSFQPDFCWLKNRDAGNRNALFDVLRTATYRLRTDGTDASVADADTLTSFNSDGFTVGADADGYGANQNGASFTSWNWKANGAGSANTDGSISSTVSANTTSGFSVVKWTNSTSNAGTIGHGLGVAPKMIIFKTTSAVTNWYVYHKSIGAGNFLELNGTVGSQASANLFDNTEPTTSVFSTGTNPAFINNTMIAYCFAEKQCFSKFSSYTGNGNADGTFVYTGFKPAFFLLKKTSATDDWHLFDTKRDAYNMAEKNLRPNRNDAETTASVDIDILSNGVKLKNSDDNGNASGSNYIYMAFAEAPLVGTNNVPCTAR